MSSFSDHTPLLRVEFENPFLRKRYPDKGALLAVIDTGYEGFAAVPNRIFEALSLDELRIRKRFVGMANGREVESRVALASVGLPDLRLSLDGPLEVLDGLSEVLLGTFLLSRFRLTIDYCLRRTEMTVCR